MSMTLLVRIDYIPKGGLGRNELPYRAMTDMLREIQDGCS